MYRTTLYLVEYSCAWVQKKDSNNEKKNVDYNGLNTLTNNANA
jgi:hypothetical protein